MRTWVNIPALVKVKRITEGGRDLRGMYLKKEDFIENVRLKWRPFQVRLCSQA